MSLADAFESIDLRNQAIVARQTWGHLAPKPVVKHKLTLVFCWASYGGTIVPISMESETLDDSPWFYSDMSEFIEAAAKVQGRVYRFEGTYQKFKGGTYRFVGQSKIVV